MIYSDMGQRSSILYPVSPDEEGSVTASHFLLQFTSLNGLTMHDVLHLSAVGLVGNRFQILLLFAATG